MLDWRVAEQLPDDPTTDDTPKAASQRLRYAWLTVGVSLVVGVLVAGVFYTYSQRNTALYADLTATIQEEIRAQASGDMDIAAEYADPTASNGWYARYASQFRDSTMVMTPTVQNVQLAGDLAQVEVVWPTTPAFVQQQAYRSVNGQWKRTPFVAATEPITDTRTSHFVITGTLNTVNDLTTTPGLQLNLEGLRGRVLTYWGDDVWDEYLLTIAVFPSDLAPAVEYSDARRLHINTPSLTPFDPTLPLSPQSQYRLAVTEEVVRWLATPQWVRDILAGKFGNLTEADIAASHDWLVMLDLLQQAEARQWVLNAAERRDLRNYWRAELNHKWIDPFTAQLPLTNTPADYDTRMRWVMVNLMVERQIAVGGPGAVGRLAQTLQNYPSVYFDPVNFFTAIVGGAPDDVRQQMEMYLVDEP